MRCLAGGAFLFALCASALAPVTALELEAPGPRGPLRGTLLSPDTAASAPVLIIPGSGPTDRDGNSPLGIRAATYRRLAEGLAGAGIPSLRIDKRGLFGSADAVPDPNDVTIRDYATDIRRWVETLRKQGGAQCVWLLGHSEGGLVALAAAQDAADICGLILVATPGQPLGEILRGQLRDNPANAPILDQALRAVDRLEAGQRVDPEGLSPALLPLFRPEVQGFLIDAFSYDPPKLLAGTALPTLILQGGRDLQVGESNARRLSAAQPNASLQIVADANHVLKTVISDDLSANLATYAAPDLPLADGVVSSIVEFIQARRQ